jgi:methionyl-tRNA synthetase
MTRKFFITTPIYYVNAEPHIGNAYTTVAADAMARYRKMQGCDVFFLTGSDEHGKKMAESAKQQGVTPKELVDRLVPKFKETWKLLDIEYDRFIRTTDADHEHAVKTLFKTLADKGDVYKGTYKGWYCVPCERYLTGATAETHTCPVCNRPGESLEEENYFFKLSQYQGRMLDLLEKNPTFVQPDTRRNEVMSRVKMGLEDVSVSRASLPWGIPMPGDEKHVIWVWFDALINYLTAAGYPDDKERLAKYWPADVHFIAKDIVWFHAVIWPCMLMAAGIEPPKQVFTHGYWTMNSEKISKSKGNVVYPRDITEKFGVNALRYFLLREVPFGLDGDFNHDAFQLRYNGDLGNDLGNLVLRAVTMAEKYFGGRVPEPGTLEGLDADLRKTFEELPAIVAKEMDGTHFSIALEKIWNAVKRTNRYVEETKPWVLAKDPAARQKLETAIYCVLESLRLIAVHIYPFMPAASAQILSQMGFDTVKNPPMLDRDTAWGALRPGTTPQKGVALFPRIQA